MRTAEQVGVRYLARHVRSSERYLDSVIDLIHTEPAVFVQFGQISGPLAAIVSQETTFSN